MAKPAVSVVIPTIGRPELGEALSSVRRQVGVDGADVEIIVVVDKPQGALDSDAIELLNEASAVLWTGGLGKAGYARNLGIQAAKGRWVALLDDDDTWEPSKLANQLTAARACTDPSSVVISSRVRQGVRSTGRVSGAIPGKVYREGRIEDFLFRARRPSIKRAVMYTSTIFCGKELACKVPWDPALPRHQDWDWLCRLQDEAAAQFLQIESDDVRIWSGTEGSLSASTDWSSSLTWARQFKDRWDPRTYVDFIAAQPLRYAMASRSFTGVRLSLKEIRSAARLPGLGPATIGLGGATPRGLAIRAMTRDQLFNSPNVFNSPNA